MFRHNPASSLNKRVHKKDDGHERGRARTVLSEEARSRTVYLLSHERAWARTVLSEKARARTVYLLGHERGRARILPW